MRFVSLDTAADEPYNPLARLMQERPTAAHDRVKTVRTKAGNIIKPVQR